ncbi:MAG: hypothetical protein Q4F27_01175 [Desulfovibrionaceae bacterium]|nr:hypothetical protein [Desulfovibrionaceae bacterium]
MSSISGINTYSSAMYQWQNQLLQNNSSSSGQPSASDSQSSLFSSATSMSSQISGMVELTKYAMNAMGLSSDSKVTFSQITRYRQQLEENFNSAVKEGLEKQGLDPNTRFAIQINDDGSATVQSDHADCAKIQAFFDANPDLIKNYRQIEALAGIDDARKAMQLSPATVRKRLQIESMAAWWAGSGSASSYFGNYSNSGLSLLNGLNLSV